MFKTIIILLFLSSFILAYQNIKICKIYAYHKNNIYSILDQNISNKLGTQIFIIKKEKSILNTENMLYQFVSKSDTNNSYNLYCFSADNIIYCDYSLRIYKKFPNHIFEQINNSILIYKCKKDNNGN